MQIFLKVRFTYFIYREALSSYTSACTSQEVICSHETTVTDGCALTCAAGNWTQDLWKSSQCCALNRWALSSAPWVRVLYYKVVVPVRWLSGWKHVEGENQLPKVVLWPPHVCWGTCLNLEHITHIYTVIKIKLCTLVCVHVCGKRDREWTLGMVAHL